MCITRNRFIDTDRQTDRPPNKLTLILHSRLKSMRKRLTYSRIELEFDKITEYWKLHLKLTKMNTSKWNARN